MYNILISGYYGFDNIGDESILRTLVSSLREHIPDCSLTVLSHNPASTREKYGVEAVDRMSPVAILRAVKKCDMLISGGGSLLQDVTSLRSLFYYLFIILMGKMAGKKVMLYSHGIGPIRNTLARKLTKIVCSKADLITVRDADSQTELLKMGISGRNIIVTADSVLALPVADKSIGQKILQNAGIDINRPVLGISVRPWINDINCFKVIAAALKQFKSEHDAQIVLLPLQYPADLKSCAAVNSFLKDEKDIYFLDSAYNTEEFLSLIGNFKLLLGMRLHALVFAAVMKVPLLAISYDPKVDAFVNTAGGVLAGSVDDIKKEQLVNVLKTAWCKPPVVQNERMEQLRSKAQLNLERTFALLRGEE
mgnify:CR=1 FL=1